MNYELPNSLTVCGVEYSIRSDYRVALDIFVALADPELSGQEKAEVALTILYQDYDTMPVTHRQEALEKCVWFLNCGDGPQDRRAPKLMDWEQDFPYIVAPINRVVGREIRSIKHFHWWSFISAYYEIGDCLFAQIIRIRDKLVRGKPLDKQDRDWYQKNRRLVDLRAAYTKEDDALLGVWLGR